MPQAVYTHSPTKIQKEHIAKGLSEPGQRRTSIGLENLMCDSRPLRGVATFMVPRQTVLSVYKCRAFDSGRGELRHGIN